MKLGAAPMVPTNQPKQLELFPDHLPSRFFAEPEPPSGDLDLWEKRGEVVVIDAGMCRRKAWLGVALFIALAGS